MVRRVFIIWSRAASLAASVVLALASPPPAMAQTGCQTGAVALANAYVHLNPFYAIFYGDLQSYVASNRPSFVANGDAVRCAHALAQALMTGALATYDANAVQDAIRTRQAVDAQLGALGISPISSPQALTPSEELYFLALRFDRLARVLPPTAAGDYGPLHTPTTQLEQLEMFAEQYLQTLIQDPFVASALSQQEALIKQCANSEYQMVLGMAAALGP
jgi:hypothetical protein